MKKETRLYNVIFPVWMLILFPVTWLIAIPANFIIDSLVILLCIHFLKIEDKKDFYRKTILWVVAFGFLSDILGSIYMTANLVLEVVDNPDSPLVTIPGVLIAGLLIFVFNYYFTLKNYDKNIRFKVALTLAIATAPYTFFIPTRLIYGY